MAAADIVNVMDGIGDRLATITGLRVHRYTPDAVSPPSAIVDWPEVEYDFTAGRGSDRMLFPVHIVVGKVSERSAAAALGAYISGSGASSVKTAIEGSGGVLGGYASTTRVMGATVTVVTIAAVDYLSATFQVEVIS